MLLNHFSKMFLKVKNGQLKFLLYLPQFFSYKTKFFSFKNNSKNLDPSSKMDLDIWDCLGRVNSYYRKNFMGLVYLFVVILERRKPTLIVE